MSIFPNARNFQVFGGEFHTHENHYAQTGIDILLEASTPEASVESEEIYKRPCCPGTREQQIASITNWATSNFDVEPIFWMRGPAGVGKSSIATTCAQNLQVSGQLGAAFFFSVNGRRSDHSRFFPTIAYQLSTVFPDYHDVLDRKISSNKNIIKTAMPSQFRTLIVEPLQELEKRGILIERKTIFVDGLDECRSKDAQAEIIEIIAASVRSKSTPFRWAVFSREEPRIVATFHDGGIPPHCRFAYLPISQEINGEIELYLRSGFRQILQGRNLSNLASSWPNDDDVRKLVDAAAGLFAYPATVLRFISQHSYLGFEDALQAALDATLQAHVRQTTSPFSELDALYVLIMQQIPLDILLPTQLLLSHLTMTDTYGRANWFVALICNQLNFSEALFAGIHNHLHAVISVQSLDLEASGISDDLVISDLDQFISRASPSLRHKLTLGIHGTIGFYHKSFYDFLIDSSRSTTFCVTTPSTREKLFDCFVQQHLHFERGYIVQGSELTFSQDAPTPSSLLSRPSHPHGGVFVDMYLKLLVFRFLSDDLSHDHPRLSQFLQDVPTGSLRKLAELDYHKYLNAKIMLQGVKQRSGLNTIGITRAGISKIIYGTEFIRLDNYDTFDPAAFLVLVKRLNKLGIIKPFHPGFPSTLVTLYNLHFRRTKHGRNWGRYVLGRGTRSVVWYWEFDTKMRYFHEFRTTDYAGAMSLYNTKKFEIWDYPGFG